MQIIWKCVLKIKTLSEKLITESENKDEFDMYIFIHYHWSEAAINNDFVIDQKLVSTDTFMKHLFSF